MLVAALQIAELASLAYLLSIIWRLSKRPHWRIRCVIYGWAAIFGWSLIWAVFAPSAFRSLLDSKEMINAFLDGTIAMACLVGGWFYPAAIVAIRHAKPD